MEDTYSYRGWLVSDSFLKRTAAVFGYALVAPLIIGASHRGVRRILGRSRRVRLWNGIGDHESLFSTCPSRSTAFSGRIGVFNVTEMVITIITG